MSVLLQLGVLLAAFCLAAGITVPAGAPVIRRQVLQPVRTVRLHRSGPAGPFLRVRNVPVKRIYVPMKVAPQAQRYVPQGGYKVAVPPQQWRPKEVQAYRQPPHLQPYRPQQLPHGLGAQSLGPPRKVRNPKPKYINKSGHPKYSKKQHQQQQLKQQALHASYDSYRPSYTALVTDSYGAPKPASYKPPATTYGRPIPFASPEPPKKSTVILQKDEPATSYVNVYQGDKAKDQDSPTYGFSQSHSQSYEKKHKGTVYSDNEALVTNHRPVYKHKSDTVSSVVSEKSSEEENTGSFQPPKQTYGFQPYEEAGSDGSYGPSQPAQQYYKKQPDTVLGPNYFEQAKSS